MQAICFKCRFVGIGVVDAACPSCGFPLIVNTASVALGAQEIEHWCARKSACPPLPGVNPEPRKAQLLAERRRERAQQAAEAKKSADARKKARRLIIGEVFAASALLAGLAATLHVLGAF